MNESIGDIVIIVYKIKMKLVENDCCELKSILTKGLYMTGHIGSGAYTSVDLRNNVGYYSDTRTIINELNTASDYKDSVGLILIRIADCDLNKNIYITDESGFAKLNPKYIVGFVPCDKNYHIGNIVLPPKKQT